MITKEILELINNKLRSIIYYLTFIGLAFFILAVVILFYPNIVQFIFILGFFTISFMAFLTAIKINHIKDIFAKVLIFFKKSRGRK